MRNSKTNWLVKTAIGITLIIIAQLIGKMIPPIAIIFGPFSISQLITGSLVNFILFSMTMLLDAKSGVTVGVLSSVFATLIGITMFPILTLAIALGNAVLVVVFVLFYKNNHKILNYIALFVAALAKYVCISVMITFLIRYIPDIKEPQIKMLTIMFSWPQLITALCGGILSFMCMPLIRKGISQNN